MTRIQKILLEARVVLADKSEERWTDLDLLNILSEGHRDLCKHTKMLRNSADLVLDFNTALFSLPEDCWQLTRITYEGVRLPFITEAELDATTEYGTSRDWQSDTGEPEALIYDARNLTEARLYPIPVPEELSSPFGFLTALDDAVVSSPFGVVTDVSDSTIDPFGVVTGLKYTVNCQYISVPLSLEAVEDELSTPALFDTALKYYVIGNAFLTDLQEAYQTKGTQQLGFYNRELELATGSVSKNHKKAALANHTTYRNF